MLSIRQLMLQMKQHNLQFLDPFLNYILYSNDINVNKRYVILTENNLINRIQQINIYIKFESN